MKEKLYQNDFPELVGVQPSGCLFMCLLDIVAQELGHELTREKVHAVYGLCNERGLLGTSESSRDKGAYVWDHTAVLNMASIVMGRKDVAWEYCARIYSNRESSKGRKNYIVNKEYECQATAFIFQIKTCEGTGHFKRLNYDPWKPGTREINLKSIRYYRRIS